MSCPARLYAFRKPKNHRLPIPRWRLALPGGTSHVCTAYIGIQQHSTDPSTIRAKTEAISAIQEWLLGEDSPSASETFSVIAGNDKEDATVWVCYWLDSESYNRSLRSLGISSIYGKLAAPGRASVGMWLESFSTGASRLETNYSGLDYLPGLARMPGTGTEEHEYSAYWGAARDRIPDSAHDLFPATEKKIPTSTPRGFGQYLAGTSYENMVHIRSGQFWENCRQQESTAYEEKLEPTLRSGLEYLWENPSESGVIGLRYLRNIDSPLTANTVLRKETCGAGFFSSLESLETWAKTHRSHLRIYGGALTHFKTFGDERKLRTWHEVSVLREGQARFEYINCAPETGAISTLSLLVKETLQ